MSLTGSLRNRHYESGLKYFDHGQYESAVREFKIVVSEESGSLPAEKKLARFYLGEAHAALAESHIVAKGWAAAEDHLRQALEINPHYPDLHYQLARVCFLTDRLGEAQEQVSIALRINPKFAKAIYLDGLIRYRRGDTGPGILRLKDAATEEKGYNTQEFQRALEFDDQGLFDEAYSLFAKVGEMRVDEIGELVYAARENLRQGKVCEAEANLREALRLNPDYPDLHNLMGQVWVAKGEYLPAVNEFKAAILANPRFISAHVNLGKACKALGVIDAAKNAWKQALSLDPENEEVRELLKDAS